VLLTAARCLAVSLPSHSERSFRGTDLISNTSITLTVMSASVCLLSPTQWSSRESWQASSVSIQVPIGSILVKSFHCQNSSSATEESHKKYHDIRYPTRDTNRAPLSCINERCRYAKTDIDLYGNTASKLWPSLLQRRLESPSSVDVLIHCKL
jgi:hypothetical protein